MSSPYDPGRAEDEPQTDAGIGDSGGTSGEPGQSGTGASTQVELDSMSTPESGSGATNSPESDSGATDDTDASAQLTPDAGVTGEPDAQAPKPDEDDAGSCGEKIVGCDPIRKTGCAVELQMQCDVDVFAATPTGVCVFNAPPVDPNSCLYIPPTESCPAGQTCVEAKCHAICLCDSDCDADKCCSQPVGAGGFKVCTEC